MSNNTKILKEGNNSADDLRCADCSKLLAKKLDLSDGFQIKCLRCKNVTNVFENALEQVVISDPDGVILFVNKATETVSGFSSAEIIGKSASLWGNQMSKEFYKDMWKILSVDKKPFTGILKNKSKSGRFYSVDLTISPILDDHGNVKFYVGIEKIINDNLAK